jgi:hypothetical protein
MGKPCLKTRRTSLSLRELAEQTNISRSTLSRMPDEQLQALSEAVDAGTWSKNWRPSPRKQEAPATDPLLDALRIAEAACIRAHFTTVGIRMGIKESDPVLYGKLGEVLKHTRLYIE